MTDKVQKIREEVERLMNELIQEKEKGFGSDSDDACILELLNVLTYIDSLQKEPAPKILEDMLNAKTPAESLGISQKEHDRIVDELIYGKEPEMVDVDDLTNKEEEPVSEDLEKASKEWLTPQLDKSYAVYGEAKMMELTRFDGYAMLDAIEFGAKWQKQQDDREIKMVRELLADFDKHCDEYHEAGFKHGQEALMKDAVVSLVTDVIIHNDGDEVKYSVAYPIGKRPFNKGDKVKVIVIKED